MRRKETPNQPDQSVGSTDRIVRLMEKCQQTRDLAELASRCKLAEDAAKGGAARERGYVKFTSCG